MRLMLHQKDASGYLICSGQSISLKEIIDYVFDKIGVSKTKYRINTDLLKPAEILDIYGDNSKAKKELNWENDLSFFEVLDILIAEEQANDPN